jgi:hypothetical protein
MKILKEAKLLALLEFVEIFFSDVKSSRICHCKAINLPSRLFSSAVKIFDKISFEHKGF